jgi:uncharacterized membrane protein
MRTCSSSPNMLPVFDSIGVHIMRVIRSALFVLAVVTPLSAQASFEELGELPGGDYFQSQALDVSGDGRVVVGSGTIVYVGSEFTSWDQQAVRWENGVLTSMRPAIGRQGDSIAWGASADGSVITGSRASGSFVWASGVVSPLGDLPGGGNWSRGSAVSGDGTVIV